MPIELILSVILILAAAIGGWIVLQFLGSAGQK